MMLSVVLDGNLLEEVVLELMILLNNVNLMYLQLVQKVMMKGISVCARTLMKSVCLKAYAGLVNRSSVCTREIMCQVAYG